MSLFSLSIWSCHSEQLSFFALFYQSTPSCLKFIKWGLGGGGPCDFSVSPFVQIPPLVFDLLVLHIPVLS